MVKKLGIRLFSIVGGVVLLNSTIIAHGLVSNRVIQGLPTPDYYEDVQEANTKTVRSLDFKIQSNTVVQQTAAQEAASTAQSTGAGTYSGVSLSADDRRYLANTVMNEVGGAGPDSYDGNPKTSPHCNVACCILNRMISTRNDFKTVNTIKEVILQKNQFSNISRAWNQPEGWATDECYKAVDYVLEHGDITGGALFFMTPAAAAKSSQSWVWKNEFLFFDGEHNYWKP